MDGTQDPLRAATDHALALAAAREQALDAPQTVLCCGAIGERVKELRMERGLSRADLSTLTGLTRHTLLLIENGWLPDDDLELMVADLARGLEVPCDELWGTATGTGAAPVVGAVSAHLGRTIALLQRIGNVFTLKPLLVPEFVRGDSEVRSARQALETDDRGGRMYLRARLGPRKSGAVLSLHRAADGVELARTVLDPQGAGEITLDGAAEGDQLHLHVSS